ncbi:hypothetical protein C8E02_1126 [Vogesella indigofera]|uniref:Uncharacterized protein n=1 Tax=Vogesella indigofera TaxID=45465 RepID=A0A495BJW7_VOGIN|nr:hypothetical protein [Vogesella indigofera]RKQ61355.1 hypothetical protein C8E02_1126 [Vogesella indigofera]
MTLTSSLGTFGDNAQMLCTIEKQAEIKGLLQELGWSQAKFCGEYFDLSDEFGDGFSGHEDEELTRLQHRFKKELTRQTTKPERLQTYIDFILAHDEYRGSLIKPRMVYKPYDKQTMATIQKMSQALTKLIEQGED